MYRLKLKRVTTSFLSEYGKVKTRIKKIDYLKLDDNLKIAFISKICDIANKYDITIYSYSNDLLLGEPRVKKGVCIDGELLTQLFGGKVSKSKDKGQREECGCTKSIDIGNYTQKCNHNCIYCYANK